MIAVVDSGSGNLRSVAKAIEAAGGSVQITSDPSIIKTADKLVVPGQGAFGACMKALAAGLGDAIRSFIGTGRPYLGICLGLQILFDSSEEQGPCRGLGLFAGEVVRFRPDVGKIPHMGWNSVTGTFPGVVDGSHFYFVHSYHAVPKDPSIIALTSDYGGEFVAAVQKDNVRAVQFHPEKSQRAGLALLEELVRS